MHAFRPNEEETLTVTSRNVLEQVLGRRKTCPPFKIKSARYLGAYVVRVGACEVRSSESANRVRCINEQLNYHKRYFRFIFRYYSFEKKGGGEDISLVLVFYILFWQVGKYIEQSGYTPFIEIEGLVNVWSNEPRNNFRIYMFELLFNAF